MLPVYIALSWAQVGAAVLAIAATAKLLHPDRAADLLARLRLPRPRMLVRAGSCVEAVVGGFWLVSPSVLSASLGAFTFLALGGIGIAGLRVAGGPVPCGCLGASDADLGIAHVIFDLSQVVALASVVVVHRFSVWARPTVVQAILYVTLLVLASYLAVVMLIRLEQALRAYRHESEPAEPPIRTQMVGGIHG